MLVGLGWCTVELDRAESELDPWLGPRPSGVPPGVEVDADGLGTDEHLGARVRLREGAGLPGAWMVLLEPSTEGRTAASLARDGEGPCALYLRPAVGLDAWLDAARGRGVTASSQRDGPFGVQVLLAGSPAGPHVIVTEGRTPVSVGRGGGYHRAMNDAAAVTVRAATADDAERFATLLTDEGYPAGASDLAARIARFSTDGRRASSSRRPAGRSSASSPSTSCPASRRTSGSPASSRWSWTRASAPAASAAS